jgi:hypothetical protein
MGQGGQVRRHQAAVIRAFRAGFLKSRCGNGAVTMTARGHSRQIRDVRDRSALSPIATYAIERTACLPPLPRRRKRNRTCVNARIKDQETACSATVPPTSRGRANCSPCRPPRNSPRRPKPCSTSRTCCRVTGETFNPKERRKEAIWARRKSTLDTGFFGQGS